MSIVQVGLGSYTTVLPVGGRTISNYNGVPIDPKIATDFSDAIPTNSWMSSFVFSFFGDAYSAPTFAGPVNMQGNATGLGVGYTSDATIYTFSGSPLTAFQYIYHTDLNVGLMNMHAAQTVLAQQSEWSSTVQWNDASSANQFEATFAQGSPFVYYERTAGAADAVITPQALTNNTNSVGQPNASNTVFEISHVNGVYDGGQLSMNMLVNAAAGNGSVGGNSIEARISIDSNGDGKFDYAKTMNYFPLDGSSTSVETYTQNEAGRSGGASTTGSLVNLNNATIKVEVWQPFGSGEAQVENASSVTLPFNQLNANGAALSHTLYLGTNNAGAGILTATPQPAAILTVGEVAGQSIVPWAGAGTIWYDSDNVVGITVNGNHYGLFAPVGSTWHLDNGQIVSDLNGKDFFSTALLPDNSISTLQYFYEHAFAKPIATDVSFNYDPAASMINTTFTTTTELQEPGFSDVALTSLYPNQYLYTQDNLNHAMTYNSPEGEMILLNNNSNSFTTHTPFTGILPALPNMLTDTENQQLSNFVEAQYQAMMSQPQVITAQDTYFSGVAMGKLGELTQLASQVGNTQAAAFFLHTIEAELENWFTVGSQSSDKQFYYNPEWNTLINYPAAFNADTESNDPNLQLGYYVKAAAVIAQFDPTWAQQWGDMVNFLVKDLANTDPTDRTFPFLRSLSPYTGIGWASGHGAFSSGNNEESSSEAINLAAGILTWGAQTHNQSLVDLGAYMYATQVAAINQYWFDINDTNFPDGFNSVMSAIKWSGGGSYSTWFSADPAMVAGIEFLPVTGASLYLGLDPAYVQQNYNQALQHSGGNFNSWTDIMMEYQALFNPAAAVAAFNINYQPEEGESYAHTYAWINNLNHLGQVDASITADTPFFGVFNNQGIITYVAYNPSATSEVVTFSDGTQMTLQSQEQKAMNVNETWSSISGVIAGTVQPAPQPEVLPTPAPVVTPTPEPTPLVDSSGIVISGSNIYGTVNADTIHAGNSGFHIYAGAGDNMVYGGAGNDRMYSDGGSDTMMGGNGADFINAGLGNNIYTYLTVNDSTTTNMDTIEQFKHGIDKVDLSALNINSANVHLNIVNDLATLTVDNSDFAIKFIAITNGSIALNDIVFNADAAPVSVTPAPTVTVTVTPVPITPAPVVTPTPTPSVDSSSIVISGSNIYGTVNADTIHAGNSGFHIYAGAGDNMVYGGAGNDRMYSDGGSDTMMGGNGADFINAGLGNNIYTYLTVNDSTTTNMDTIEQFKHGIDKVDLSALNINSANVHLNIVNDLATLTVDNSDFAIKFIAITNGSIALNDIVFNADAAPVSVTPAPTVTVTPVPTPAPVSTSTASSSIGVVVNGTNMYGTNNDDTIVASDSQNYNIYGAYGNDTLMGGAGNDRIYGINGNSTLVGGGGADFLNGGTGHNTYQYLGLNDSTALQTDTIESFKSNKDTLDLTLLHVNQNDIHITTVVDSSTLTIDHTNFVIHFIASDPISHDDIKI